MSFDRKKYLITSGLCDFNRSPAIRRKAMQVTTGARNRRQRFDRIFACVKELQYGLEDWDVKASTTLRKGWGMCSGKTNLLVALLRSIGIPARYRIYSLKADNALWEYLDDKDSTAGLIGKLSDTRDHVDCEVWLGKWVDCDPGRDSDMEKGMVKLGLTLERHKVADAGGKVLYTRLANFDEWAKDRQKRRTFRSDRIDAFRRVNADFEKLRKLGKSAT